MHIQVVTYRLAEEMSDPDFIEANQGFAEAMAAVPGLLAKVWLKNADEGVFGGVYIWRDRAAYDSFLASELWGSVLGDDSMTDVASNDYAVMEDLTKATQPALAIV
jgi:hypothetical protein